MGIWTVQHQHTAPAPGSLNRYKTRKTMERLATKYSPGSGKEQGKQEEADKALAEFRRRYPGYVLSDEMKAKVERK